MAGRKLKCTPEVVAEARKRVESGEMSVEEAAASLKVGKTQLYAAMKAAEASGGAVAASLGGGSGSGSSGGPKAPPGGSVEASSGDRLELGRRILRGRNPAALREMDAGLEVYDTGGESALVPWLARPIELAGGARDPRDVLEVAMRTLQAQLLTYAPGQKAASTASAIATIAKAIEAIDRGRPAPESEDALVARTREVREETLRILETTVAAEERRLGLP